MHLLFYKEGFSYWVKSSEAKTPKVNHFKVSHFSKWEEEISKELEINLSLRRNFEKVISVFMSSFFNLVPENYTTENSEVLLNFSETEFEDNLMLESETNFGSKIIYGTSQKVISRLKDLYGKVEFCHSGKILLNSIDQFDGTCLHLNLFHHQLEIAFMKDSKLVFYNLFDTPSGEDVLFFSLFTMEQLGIDANKISVKTYGQLLPDTQVYQTLKKYVRNLKPAIKDEVFLENFSLLNT